MVTRDLTRCLKRRFDSSRTNRLSATTKRFFCRARSFVDRKCHVGFTEQSIHGNDRGSCPFVVDRETGGGQDIGELTVVVATRSSQRTEQIAVGEFASVGVHFELGDKCFVIVLNLDI